MLRLSRLCLISALLIVPPTALAAGIPDAQYVEIKAAYPAFASAEESLNETYQFVMSERSPVETEALRQQQRAWVLERGAVYQAIWESADTDEAGKVYILTKMAKDRAFELKLLDEKLNRVSLDEDEPDGGSTEHEEAVADSGENDAQLQSFAESKASASPSTRLVRSLLVPTSLDKLSDEEVLDLILLIVGGGATASLLIYVVHKARALARQRLERNRLRALATLGAKELCGHAAPELNKLEAKYQVALRKKELAEAEAALKASLRSEGK